MLGTLSHIQIFLLLPKNLIYCKEIVFDSVSNDENNRKSLHPTSAHNYNSLTSTLSPNSSPVNPPPTILYPDKLPKYIEQKDDIDMKKSREKNKNKGKNKKGKKKNKNEKTKNKNKKTKNKKKRKNDMKNKKEKNMKKKESNGIDKNIIREKSTKKKVKQNNAKNLKRQPKENNSNEPMPRRLTKKPSHY